MDAAGLLERMQGLRRDIAAAEAELAGAIVAFVELRRGEVLDDFATDEIAVALRCGRGRVLDQLRLAETMQASLPATWAAWQAGEIDGYTASRVMDAAERLTDPALLNAFDAEAATRAVEKTTPQLASWLARKVATLEPDHVEPRYRRATARRRVDVQLGLDGMGSLWASTDAMDLTAIDRKLTRLANDLGAEDPRSTEQRRVDLFVDLLLGRHPDSHPGGQESAGKPAPVVAVTVPVQSLLGLDTSPAMLDGNGSPVPASIARDILANPGTLVYRLLTDPAGRLLDVTQLGRFPTAKLRFAVDVRDQTCRFPSCTRPGVQCDADHTVPYPQGPTGYRNLGLLCRRHHRLKTSGQVRLRQVEPGVFEWTMPNGSIETVRPEPQPLGRWPDDPPLTEPLPYADDLAAHLLDGDDPETLSTEELDALLTS